jgi:hypothetical protein
VYAAFGGASAACDWWTIVTSFNVLALIYT